jgi:hypothetical protein
MAQYFVESSHTKQECLRALDETVAKGADVLGKFSWGCMAGEHTGYAIVEAESESVVQNMIPTFLRDRAHIVKVGKFTPEQIKAYHEK